MEITNEQKKQFWLKYIETNGSVMQMIFLERTSPEEDGTYFMIHLDHRWDVTHEY